MTRGIGRAFNRALRTLKQDPVLRCVATAGLGAIIALVVLLVHEVLKIPASAAETLFVIFHPLHILVGALTIVRMLAYHGRMPPLPAAAIAYPMSIAIVTIADSLLPFLGELLLALPSRHVHYGFVEVWWIVHPLAAAGILLGLKAPRVRLPWLLILAVSALPPLYDIAMAMWKPLDPFSVITIFIFVAASVWVYTAGTALFVAWMNGCRRSGSVPALEIGRYLDEVQGWYRR